MTDAQCIDWLEAFVNREGALLLHDGNRKCGEYSGLGLRPGYLSRTLREAIVDASGVDSALDGPQDVSGMYGEKK